MGVIDLDARVKKLEEGGGGGADPGVIDQLESAVTAIENSLIPGTTAIDLEEGITDDTGAGGCYYSTVGGMMYVHLAASGLTADTNTLIGTLPSGYRPTGACVFPALSSGGATTATVTIGASDGTIYVNSKSTSIRGQVVYPLIPTT